MISVVMMIRIKLQNATKYKYLNGLLRYESLSWFGNHLTTRLVYTLWHGFSSIHFYSYNDGNDDKDNIPSGQT